MIKLKNEVNINVYDIIILCLIVSCVSFYDNTFLVLSSQLINFMYLAYRCIIKNTKISKMLFSLILWTVLFSSFSMLSSFWTPKENITLFSCIFSFIQAALLAMCVLSYGVTKDRLAKIDTFIICAAVCICIRFFISIPFSNWGNQTRFSSDSFFGNNVVAVELAYAAIIALRNIIYGKKRVIYILFCILFMFVMMMTGTRKGILIFVVALGIMEITKHDKIKIKNIIISFVLVAIFYELIMNIDILYNSIGYRVESFFDFFSGGETDNSTLGRYSLMMDGFRVFGEHPVLGVGMDGYRYVNQFGNTYSHNNFVEILADLGIIGFAIYYGFLISLLKKSYKIRKNNITAFMFISLILIVGVASVQYSDEFTYIMLGYICASINIYKNKADNIKTKGE